MNMTRRATITVGDTSKRDLHRILEACSGYSTGATARVQRGMYKGKQEPCVEVIIYNLDNNTVDDFEGYMFDLAATLREAYGQECVLLVLDAVEVHIV